MTQGDHPFCEDCGIRSQLGSKCRDCYAKWSRRLWADIPGRLAELTAIARALNATPQGMRKAIARVGRGEVLRMTFSGKDAELIASIKRCLEGPYRENLQNKLQAIIDAPAEKGAAPTTRAKERAE